MNHVLSRFFLISMTVVAALTANVRADEAESEIIPFYQYKPTYFLFGHPYAKIQVSFKVRVYRTLPIYFAYSQLMYWALYRQSPYFHDLNYNPDAFYRLSINDSKDQWMDFSPWEHESNGRGQREERSWNRAYVRYHTRSDLGSQAKLFWTFKVWFPYNYQERNPYLLEDRGLWETEVTMSDFLGDLFERGDFIFRFYPGGKSYLNPLHGGQELTYRAKKSSRNFMFLLVAQVFHGYGESLIDARENRWGFRAGFGF